MAPKYRVGIIASGRIAREHGRGWTECEHTQIVAIADAHPEAVAEYARDFSVPVTYLDYREMLDREQLDIVSVCSWDPQHAEMTIAAAARRPRAILCEKPMACSLGEGEAMVVACQRNGVKLAIGHQRRFYSCWEEARRLVAAGAIGEPRRLWSGVRAGMMNTGTHSVDFQRYVLGDPRARWVMGSVERRTDRHIFGHRVEDRCSGIIDYGNGAIGVIENELSGLYQVGAWVQGSEGMLEVSDNSLKYMSADRAGWQEFARTETDTRGYGEAFVRQAYGICAWLDGTVEEYRGESQQGLAALEIMMAVYESARLRERVELPLQTRDNPLDLAVEQGQLPVQRPGRFDERSFLVRGEGMSWLEGEARA
ncbi:MAG: Gfo/Idh/MocA family oxidoreductase [Gemmatimonadota bacterium]